jgi:thiol-disulfide isomerase/thioredoxin
LESINEINKTHMRRLFVFTVLLLAFTACNMAGNGNKYTIQGTIKNSGAAKSVYLEKMGLKELSVVDTADVDEKGNFKLEGVSETGFYRIKLSDNAFWMFYLEPSKYQVDIDATNPNDYKFTGSANNDEFMAGLKNLSDGRQELQKMDMEYRQLYQSGALSQDSMAVLTKQMQDKIAAYENSIKESAAKAKSPLVGLFMMTNLPIEKYAKETEAVVLRLEKEMPQSTYTKDMRELYNNYANQAKMMEEQKKAAENIQVGKPAPELDFKDPNGKNIKLSSLKGKVVLIDFWASWCGPCIKEMPTVIAAYNKYKDKGFDIYSVSLDKDGNAWKNAIARLGMTWPTHVSDLKQWQSDAARIYGVNSIPAAFLINKEGIIVGRDLRGPALEEKIKEVLQ